jgi:hypothetical protein
MIKQLVANGCSYIFTYAEGNGHMDLASTLRLPTAHSIAVSGSANSRIIRTTLKHSYQTTVPTFYLVGLTFVSRLELPILDSNNEFEGRWINPQNQEYSTSWQHNWTQKDVEQFVDLKLKSEVYSIEDRLEDLMYRVVSLISDLQLRGHRVLLFQTGDNLYQHLLDHPKFKLFDRPEIVEGFRWRSVAWQHSVGVPQKNSHLTVPKDMRHPEPGAHAQLNSFLVDYINKNKIL